jgi:peptide/nickel transport system ATP-binding protein
MRLLPTAARVLGGSIRFRGQDLLALPPAQMRAVRGKSISLILQEPMSSLDPVLTVGDQIQEMIRAHERVSKAQARRRAIELLDLVNIPEPDRRHDDYPYQMSGGMRQRVMIAIAIACSPAILIADEPTTALDVTVQAQILELLDTLRTRMSMAILLVTHDLGVVGQWADRVAVMYAGAIVEQADVATFLSDPVHPYSRGLLNASKTGEDGKHYTKGRLTEIPGSVASAWIAPGCRFAPRCPDMVASCNDFSPLLEAMRREHLVACPVNARLMEHDA